MKKIAPSILSADGSRLGEEITAVEAAGADWIHIDVMDGHFVPNITIGPGLIAALRKTTSLPFDVHLMIENPEKYIDAFAKAGSDRITVHVEISVHLHRTVAMIRERGLRAGVSLIPATPLVQIEPILPDIDLLLIMTVNPGFGGQKFIDGSLSKIRQAKEMIRAAVNYNERVIVDQIDGLLVDYCRKIVVQVVVRGMRALSDFEYEFQMTFMNRKLDREIESMFMMTGLRWFFVNSNIIKSAVKAGACVEGLVPDVVCEKLQEKFNKKKA